MEGGQKLEAKFLKLGKELSSFPPADDLYAHLEEIDGLLSKVEQSPSQTMLNALQPLTKALAAENLLRHSDMDVKVAVASCISEITRITAPETPYDDDIMKEIFQLIVGSLAGLDNTSSRSYKKRISILETVAKVRSCVVMIDLECDDLILEMFHHFLSSISEVNFERLSSCMETIMTLVIEESEDVPIGLLSVLLYTLKNDKVVLSFAQHLAQQVLNNCASRIRPQLVDLVQTIGAPLTEYHKVVASICEENSNAIDKIEETNSEVQVSAEQEHNAGFLENAVTLASMSNGSVQNGNGDAIECPSSPKQNYEPEKIVSKNSGSDNLESNTKNSDDSEKYVRSVTSTGDCSKETGSPKANEISTTIIERSASTGTEKKKSEASITLQAPTTEFVPSISLETKQQNVSNITIVRKDLKISQTNGNTDTVVDRAASADVATFKDDASESSKGDNVEALITVKSDYASTPKHGIYKRGRKGKKGRLLKGRSSLSAERVYVKKESGKPVEISPSNCSESENKPEKADDAEAPKNTINKSDTVSRTIGKRGRPRKELAVQKERILVDQVLQKPAEKERDNSVEISPSKGDYSDKKPQTVDDVKASTKIVKESNTVLKSLGKRGRPRKKHAIRKHKSSTTSADKVLPLKSDANVKASSATDNVETPKTLNDEKTELKTKSKRGRPKKEDVVEVENSPLDEILSSGSNTSGHMHIIKCKRSQRKVKNAVVKNKEPLDEDFISKDGKCGEPENVDDIESPYDLTNNLRIKPKDKGKKGRPKKVNIIEKESELPSEPFSLKDGSAEDFENNETITKSTDLGTMSKTKGKRGRPKKEFITKDSLMANKSSAKKQKGEENVIVTNVDSGSALKDTGSALKETVSLLKSASKSQCADKANLDSSYAPRSRRKRASNMKDAYEKGPSPKKKLDECLVGSKIKVWWPDDQQFYDGVVDSYERGTKKHKIVYTDGDIEKLILKNERWEYVEDEDMSQNKKVKTGSTRKRAKSNDQAKSSVETKREDTSRPRGRPRKETPRQKADIFHDDTSPETIKQSKGKLSSDAKITSNTLLSKLKDEAKSPGTSGKSKAKKSTVGSGTKLKIKFSKTETKNETESAPLTSDAEATEGRKRKDRK